MICKKDMMSSHLRRRAVVRRWKLPQLNLWRRRDQRRPWGGRRSDGEAGWWRRNMEDLSAWRWLTAGRWRDGRSWMRRRRRCQVVSAQSRKQEQGSEVMTEWRGDPVTWEEEMWCEPETVEEEEEAPTPPDRTSTRCIAGEIWSSPSASVHIWVKSLWHRSNQNLVWREGDAAGENVSDAANVEETLPVAHFSSDESDEDFSSSALHWLSVGCCWVCVASGVCGNMTYSPGSERHTCLF